MKFKPIPLVSFVQSFNWKLTFQWTETAKIKRKKACVQRYIFHVQHALKLTTSTWDCKNFSGGYTPGPPFQGEPRLTRREGERIMRAKRRGGKGPPKYFKQIDATANKVWTVTCSLCSVINFKDLKDLCIVLFNILTMLHYTMLIQLNC